MDVIMAVAMASMLGQTAIIGAAIVGGVYGVYRLVKWMKS